MFYFCLPSDKYTRPCNWGKEGVVREKGREKYGGVEGYGWFSLGDRACCHGAGPPIGGDLVQSLNSIDCFIIEKFFLSSCLTSHPCSSIFFFFFPLFSSCTLLHPPPPRHTQIGEAAKLHNVYNDCTSCHPLSFWQLFTTHNSQISSLYLKPRYLHNPTFSRGYIYWTAKKCYYFVSCFCPDVLKARRCPPFWTDRLFVLVADGSISAMF